MGKQSLCHHTQEAADRLVAHGETIRADVVSHAVATLKVAQAQGMSFDELVEGMLDANDLLDHPLPEYVPPASRVA